MLRLSLCAAAVVAAFSFGLAKADDTKAKTGHKNMDCCHATITKLDAKQDVITVKFMDKTGHEQEKTFHLSQDVAYHDLAGKNAKLDDFKVGDDVLITQKDGKVTELKEDDEATITKVDAKAGTVTLKMRDKDGKETEKTFTLVEDAEYFDSVGRVATLDVFRSGDQVLVIESEGRIKELKKSDKKNHGATASNQRREDKKSSSK